MKRIVSIIICLILCISVFSGCDRQQTEKRYTKMVAVEPIGDRSYTREPLKIDSRI